MNRSDDHELRDLLLHRLPPVRAQELEERLMLEEGYAERLEEARYDLLDDHATGRLTAAERADVERHLLACPEDRLRLAVARGLARRGSRAPAATPSLDVRRESTRRRPGLPVRGWATAAWIAACAVLVAVLVDRHISERRNAVAPGQLAARPGEREAATPVWTLTLLASASRGDSVRSISIPARTTTVRVQAEIASPEAGEYRLSVLDGANHVLASVEHLLPRAAGAYVYVEAQVPAQALASGIHRVVVAPQAAGGAQAQSSSSWEFRTELRPGSGR